MAKKLGIRLLKKLFLSFYLCLPLIVVQAQYRFDSWTTDNGLPQNSVFSIIQTRDGYLWLATLDGIVRFDGVRFTVFNKANSAGIRSNRFTFLFEDAHGAIWATTDNGGVTRLSSGVAKTFTTADGLPFNNVRGITGDDAGNVWVLSGEQIMLFKDERFLPADLDGLELKFNNGDWNKNIFLAVKDDVLYRFEKGKLTSQKFDKAVFENLNFRFAEEANKILWAGRKDGKVIKIENGVITKILDVIKFGGKDNRELPPIANSDLDFQTQDGERFNFKFDIYFNRTLTLLSSGKPQTISFRTAFQDREGNIWFGTDGQGLFRVRRQLITVYSKADGLTNKNVFPIFQTADNSIWIGAWNGGLSRFDDGKFTNFEVKDGLASYLPMAIYQDRRGVLWTSAHNDDGGLRVFKDGKFEKPVPYPNLPERSAVAAIYETADGAFWFGTSFGLARFQNGETTFFTNRVGLGGSIKAIIESANGGLWIASYGGLTRISGDKIMTYTEADGLPSDSVRALYEDNHGVLWIGTYDGGLGRFKDGKFTIFTAENGLFDNGVFQILEDDDGNFWMSSNRGIHRTRKQDLDDFAAGRVKKFNSTGYGISDGLLNIECNGGVQTSGIKASDGRLWFPTQDGVAVIDPQAVSFNPNPPTVLIETIKIDGDEQSATHNPPSAIEIAPNQRNLAIAYTGLGFVKSEQIRFRYRLEGLDEDWTDAGTRREAVYPYLPPGKYTFRVIAANSDNVWNEQGAAIEIVVKPAFYQTWWFWGLAFLLVIGVSLIFYKRRISQLKKERGLQQAFSRQLIASQEQERKRIAAELHDSLGQRLVVIKNLALIFLNLKKDQADEFQQIEDISAEASQAIGEVKEISYNLRPYQLDRIGLTKAIEAIVRTAQAASTIEFSAEIDDIDNYFPKDTEINFYRIVQECVNNAVKHSEASKAFVKIKHSGDNLELEISDNGKGFQPYQTESKTGGFGLIGITERVELFSGKVEVKSAPNQGTTVRIRLKSRSEFQK